MSTITLDTQVELRVSTEGRMVEVGQIRPAQDGSYSHIIIAQGALWTSEGEYLVEVLYGEESAETRFNYIPKEMPPETTGIFEVSDGSLGTFEVRYTIKGGTMIDMLIHVDGALLVLIESANEGTVSLDLPRDLMDAITHQNDPNFIFVNQEWVPYQASTTDSGSRLITINFEDGAKRIEIIFRPASPPEQIPTRLTGTVFSDGNDNGVQDSGETGIPGLTVLYANVSDSSMTGKTLTDKLGTYTFVGIPASDYLVQMEGTDIHDYLTVAKDMTARLDFAHPPIDLPGGGTDNGEPSAEKEPEPVEPTEKTGGGCLIATAAYGSEMALQVQQLRELRDNKLLQTESGRAFVDLFNEFYYSFSPAIADYERENPAFRELVKIAITPMISSMSLLNYADIDSETQVIGYGISLILLNVGMYIAAPAVVIRKIQQNKQQSR